MIREYIFCSVMESPQMASRSPGRSINSVGSGALRGWNFSRPLTWAVSVGACANVEAATRTNRQTTKSFIDELLALLFELVKSVANEGSPSLDIWFWNG